MIPNNQLQTESRYNMEVGDLMENVTNITMSRNGTERYWGFTFSYTMAAILTVSAILTLVGNGTVITVVLRYRVMRSRTNLFLVNLAVADFLVGLLLVPTSITTLISGDWIMSDVFCTINGFLNAFCLVASIHTLMYISIHKCYSLPRRQSDSFKLHKILLMMCATWIWSAVLATITITGMNHVAYKPGTSQCGPMYPHDLITYIHHGIMQVTGIIIPLGIMVFCYIKMARLIWYHSRNLQENTTMENSDILAQQKKIFWTLFIVIACFIVCWIPYNIYAMYTTIRRDKEHFPSFINPLAYSLGYINSACNPIIYALRSRSFWNGYKELWCQSKGYLNEDDFRDENGSPLRQFTSFFSIRRGSRGSLGNLSRLGSIQFHNNRKTSAVSMTDDDGYGKHPKKKFKRHKSLTEMMREAPVSGHSIIRRDGSIVIMKAGKIVSVREDKNFNKNSSTNNNQKSSNKLPIKNGNHKKDLHLHVRNKGKELSTIYSDTDLPSEEDDVFDDEITTDVDNQNIDNVVPESVNDSCNLTDVPHVIVSDQSDYDEEAGTRSSQQPLLSEDIEQNILSNMPLTPGTKYGLAKSDVCLEVGEGSGKDSKTPNSKSSSSLNKFLPSIDWKRVLGLSSSEKVLQMHKSPLLKRRLQKKSGSQHLLTQL